MSNNNCCIIGLFLFVTLSTVACQGFPAKTSNSTPKETRYISLCNILQQENSYIDKSVDIRAVLKTDNATYAYFEDVPSGDKSCVGYNTISIASASVMHDSSVVKFLGSTDDYCKQRNMVLCVVTVDMKFEAKVLESSDGPYLYLTKIFSYQYHQHDK